MDKMRAWWQGADMAHRILAVGVGVLVMLTVWLYGAGHTRYGLFDVDEAIFTEATLEMRQNVVTHGVSGFAMPTYNGEPRYHKPPLIYWVQSATMSIFGESSLLAARLPSALGALGTIALLGWWVWRMTGNRRWALASSAVMAFNLSFLVVGRAATADGVLNFASLALGLWVATMVLRPTPSWRWAVTGGLAALGMLAKGPIAWFPAILVGLAALVMRKDKLVVWRTLAPAQSFLVMFVMLVPWLALLAKHHGMGFFYEFIMVHNVGRYASGLTNTQSSNPLYYILVLLVGFFPWVLAVPAAITALVAPLAKKGWWETLQQVFTRPKERERALLFLMLVWGVVYVLFFSFSKTKLAHYIVPAYPALAVLVGWFWAVVWRVDSPFKLRQSHARWLRWVMGVMMGLGGVMVLLFAGIFGALVPLFVAARENTLHGLAGWLQVVVGFPWPLPDTLAMAVLRLPVALDRAPFWIAGLMLLAVFPTLLGVGIRRPEGNPVLWGGTLAFVWALCLALIVWGVLPMIWGYTQAPLARLAALEARAPTGVGIIHLGMHKPSMMYLSGKAFTKLENPLQLPDALVAPETWVTMPTTKVQGAVRELEARGGSAVVGQVCDGGYCMLNIARFEH